jgi:hypothetical protein
MSLTNRSETADRAADILPSALFATTGKLKKHKEAGTRKIRKGEDSFKIALAKVYRKRYTFAMSYYSIIYEYAIDNYGLITSSQASSIAVPSIELVKLAERGRLDRIGHGVYRVVPYVRGELDIYAEALALVGEGSYVFGESVLAMHGLAFVNPLVITVGNNKQVRRKLPASIKVIKRKNDDITLFEDIRSQSVSEAIRVCKGRVLTERLIAAIDEASKQGFISHTDMDVLRREIETT